MKKPVVIGLLMMLICAVVWAGYALTTALVQRAPVRNTLNATSSAAVVPSYDPTLSAADSTLEPLDREDDQRLEERAEAVLTALDGRDYEALSELTHPTRGVTFTPYSTVDPENDLCFLPEQLRKAAGSGESFLWGFSDGKGEHINLTLPEYVDRYVYNEDYQAAPVVTLDGVQAAGNALENVQEVFSDCRFVEYYYPGIRPENESFDWCALKVVLAPYNEEWYLVGLIHSEWTI